MSGSRSSQVIFLDGSALSSAPHRGIARHKDIHRRRSIPRRIRPGLEWISNPEGQGRQGRDRVHPACRQASFTLLGGEQTLAFPFMDEIAPAFLVEIKNLREPVQILDAGAIFTSQPVEYRGMFECNDETLNHIWKTSRWAVQICLQTHHLDSPNHQEPICDPGDYVIESMVNHYAFAQPWLARQDVRKFAWLLKDENYRNFHTSYSIAWLQMLIDYYDFTGDRSLVEEMAPYVHELITTYSSWRGKNGIISEAPNYMFMDWVTIGGFGERIIASLLAYFTVDHSRRPVQPVPLAAKHSSAYSRTTSPIRKRTSPRVSGFATNKLLLVQAR